VTDARPRSLETALESAAAAIRVSEARLHDALDALRAEQAQWLERLRAVERALGETAAAEGNADGVERAELREKHEALRAQRAAIGERLGQLQLAVKKLRSVIQQSQVSADYLAGGFGDADEDLMSLTQVWALEAQEEERRRLAREIHDGPAQVLANATFELEYCQRLIERDPARLPAEMEKLKADLREGLAEVRYFIFDLRPGPLAELGLAATLQRYAENFQQRSGIEVSLDLDYENVRLSPTKEVAVFRVVQEALQNVRKHSQGRRVCVTLQSGAEGMYVAVEDDGVGFDRNARTEAGGRHFGLSSMEERARLIRAELRVTSAPGRGTKVELRVPPEGRPGPEPGRAVERE
jgi:two-component system sensor histidine kinase DegS